MTLLLTTLLPIFDAKLLHITTVIKLSINSNILSIYSLVFFFKEFKFMA